MGGSRAKHLIDTHIKLREDIAEFTAILFANSSSIHANPVERILANTLIWYTSHVLMRIRYRIDHEYKFLFQSIDYRERQYVGIRRSVTESVFFFLLPFLYTTR